MTYKKGNRIISISDLPNRKRKCLIIGEDNVLDKAATFYDDEAAEMFKKQLEYFLGIKDDRTGRK